MKRALVTGGAGFIGSHVVDELLAADCDVWVVDNFVNGRRENIAVLDDDRILKKDIRNRDEVNQAIRELKPDFVFHLAAIHFIPYCNQHPIEASQINILGTRVLLDALSKEHVPERLFFASTAAVYPPKEGEHLETDETYPMDIYGITKLSGESMLQLFAKQRNVHTVVGRLFNAVGPRETNPHLLPDIFKQVNAGKRTIQLGNLEPRRDFIHARDMAKAIVSATLQVEEFATYNIGYGAQYSVREIVQMIEELLGEKIEITQADKLIRKVERPSLLAGIGRIKSATGWAPTIDIKATLSELLAK